jgi:O-antigen ligase
VVHRSSSNQTVAIYQRLERYAKSGIEASWLFAVGIVPIMMLHEDWILGFIQVPKVGILRTVALILIGLLSLEWAVKQPAGKFGNTHPSEWVFGSQQIKRLVQSISSNPAHWVYVGASSVLVATLISTIFAPIKSVSLWGMEPGWDTYAFYNIISYVVIFAAIATHLRHEDQLNRIILVMTAASVLAGLYGILQHFGVELLQPSTINREQASLTMGNPIFAGSYLILTIPLTLAWALTLRNRINSIQVILIGTSAISIQTTALLFTQSRGPWVGLTAAMIAFLAVTGLTLGRQYVARALFITGLAGMIAIIMTIVPTPEKGATRAHNIGERVVSIVPSVFGGGLTYRTTIWKTAGQAFIESPWLNTKEFPEISSLSLRAMRPIIGYGPDMFSYPYTLIGETSYTIELANHGHNFIVHTAVELGLLGVMAYITLLVALGWSLRRLIHLSRGGRLPIVPMMIVPGLSAVFVGRIVEQSVGKAQISDLLQSWVLAGVIVSIVSMFVIGSRPVETIKTWPSMSNAPQNKPPHLRRLMVPVTIITLISIMWALTIYPNISASRLGAIAENSMEAGQTIAAFRELERATNISYPAAPSMLLRLSDWAAQAAWIEQNPEVKLALFQKSHQLAREALDWNSLDPRAGTSSSNATVELAAINNQFRNRAIRENVVLANLMPGFWQARFAIGQAHLRLGEPKRALEAFNHAIRLTPSTAEGLALVFYSSALAYYQLGLPEEALTAARHSWEAQPSTQVIEFLKELGMGQERL